MVSYSITEVAEMLGLKKSRVEQMLKDGQLLWEGRNRVRADSLVEGRHGWEPLDGLAGTLTVLSDHGFSREEAVEWLYENNDLLGDTPLNMLRGGFKHRVNRAVSMAGA